MYYTEAPSASGKSRVGHGFRHVGPTTRATLRPPHRRCCEETSHGSSFHFISLHTQTFRCKLRMCNEMKRISGNTHDGMKSLADHPVAAFVRSRTKYAFLIIRPEIHSEPEAKRGQIDRGRSASEANRSPLNFQCLLSILECGCVKPLSLVSLFCRFFVFRSPCKPRQRHSACYASSGLFTRVAAFSITWV